MHGGQNRASAGEVSESLLYGLEFHLACPVCKERLNLAFYEHGWTETKLLEVVALTARMHRYTPCISPEEKARLARREREETWLPEQRGMME